MKRLSALLVFALLAACADASGPEPVRFVNLLAGGAPLQEQTLLVGSSLQLSATTESGSGAPLAGRPVAWRSTAPTIASVDSSGLVQGVAPGTALIIVSAEAAADTARIHVIAPAPGEVACAAGDPGLDLRVGEVRTFSAAQAGALCVSGGGAGAEFTYIPFNATATAGNLVVEITAGGVVPAQGPPNPSLVPLAAGQRPEQNWAFHRNLRQLEREILARPRPASGGVSRSLAGMAVPNVGDRIRLSGDPDAPCTAPDYRAATVEAVTSRAIVVSDSIAGVRSDSAFTRADYENFGRVFDEVIWPTVTEAMGTPSDLDQNNRVILFYTTAVNDLTEPGSSSYTGGFFHPRDLNPNTGTNSCAASNYGEVLYLLVPDSARVGGNAVSPFLRSQAVENSYGVIGHELQHVINASSRRARSVGGEEVWLNEGLSHIAEELLFYATSGLASESNLSLNEIRATERARLAYNRYQSSNFGRLLSYLRVPQDESLIGIQRDDDLPTRGASWAFLRYAADRKTDGDAAKRQIWHSLVNGSTSGVANLERVLGVDAIQWMQDWTTAVYTDDAGLAVPLQFQQPSWNYREFFRQSRIGSYPLATLSLGNGEDGDLSLSRLQGGGAAFVRFGVAPGTRAAIRATSGGAIPPERLRISIVRTK